MIDWQPKDSDNYSEPRYYISRASWAPNGYVVFHLHEKSKSIYSELKIIYNNLDHKCKWVLSPEPFVDDGNGNRSFLDSAYTCSICGRKAFFVHGEMMWLGETKSFE